MQTWDATLARIDGDAAAAHGAALFAARTTPGFVSVGANLVYRVELDDGGTGYLKLIHANLRDRAEVEANAAYQTHLAERGAPVAPLVVSAGGRTVECFHVGGEPVVTTLSRAVPGRAVDAEPTGYAAWGRALAALQRAAESFPASAARPLRHWKANWRECVELLRPDDARAQAEVKRVEAWLRDLPQDRGALGITHADCNRSNALFDGERVHLIDFDEPMQHWFAADVARPFHELTADHPAHEGCLAALLAGYREVRPLDARLERALPGFVRMKNVEVYAWLSDQSRWAGDTLPGDRDRSQVLAAIRRSFDD